MYKNIGWQTSFVIIFGFVDHMIYILIPQICSSIVSVALYLQKQVAGWIWTVAVC